MAVYYKFKSAKDFDSVSLDGHFITVASLKDKIFQNKHLASGTDFDLVVSNAQTNEEYVDEGMLVPKNTSVLIRRVPGRPRMPIVAASPITDQKDPEVECKAEDLQGSKSTFHGANLSVTNYLDDSEWDEFGNDLYAIPEVIPAQASNQVQDAPPPSKADEDSKIQALIDTPALDWQQQTADGSGYGRGYGRGIGGRMGGRGFGRGVGLDRKTPPPGYVCHRCKVPGHFIQHCPTNGDPTFDIRKVKPPTGIPKSMLMATPDGSYALPSGAVAVLKPNEAAFEKEIEGMPSTRSVGDLPPELYCPLCKEVMKDAVLTSKCCFRSFCDKCIRDNIISKSMCVCGAQNVLADDLLPNNTVRDTINRILEANNSSGDNKGSAFQIQDMESARPKPKIPSPALSAASKGEQVLSQNKDTNGLQDTTEPVKIVDVPQPPIQNLEIAGTARVPDVSGATNESRSVKEAALQASGPLAAEDQPQKLVSEPGKKKKKKKPRMPSEMQWTASQEFAAENYMMPIGPAFNPYWSNIQPGIEGFGGPFAGPMPCMGYGLGPMPMEFPYGGHFPQDPYGPPVNMIPFPPQRNFGGYGMGFNGRPPVMSKKEFEARKADLMHKRELERRMDSRDLPKERDSREVTSSSGVPSIKLQSKANLPPPCHDDQLSDYHRGRLERSRSRSPRRRSRDPELPKRRSQDPELPRRLSRDPKIPRRRSRDPEPQRRRSRDREPPRASSKRKAEYDHYSEDEHYYHHHHEKEHSRHRQHREEDHHHHRSELSSKPPVRPASIDPPPKSSSISEKDKQSVFSRISFPEREAAAAAEAEAKKLKTVSASSSAAVSKDYQEDHHKSKAAKTLPKKTSSSTSGGNVEERYQYNDEYNESSEDDDRHFKRRPSRYVALEEERHSSRGSKEREKSCHGTKHKHSHSHR
ncbi:E3 ubiquitin ligase PARAQUAT TOLERANCE 3-like isoform X2 [Apium graveolens]|uniref:E3 ubiquitin ligase PARAQUAT TOLERANCE 3-like isoform X2 n=1 Tax=Apium graveolens TaxID=4045 RepID=UPI003D78E5DB